jgi:hypothetical protein
LFLLEHGLPIRDHLPSILSEQIWFLDRYPPSHGISKRYLGTNASMMLVCWLG